MKNVVFFLGVVVYGPQKYRTATKKNKTEGHTEPKYKGGGLAAVLG